MAYSFHRNKFSDDEDLKGEVDFDFFANDKSINDSARSNQKEQVIEKSGKVKSDKMSSRSSSRSSRGSSSKGSSRHSSVASRSKSSSRSRSRSKSISDRSRSKSHSSSKHSLSSRSSSRSLPRAIDSARDDHGNDDTTAPDFTKRSDSFHSSRSTSPKQKNHSPRSKSSLSSSVSDVTDVSPLTSREGSPAGRPPKSNSKHTDKLHGDEDRMNVETIMKALVEMDRQQRQRTQSANALLRANSIGKGGSLSYASFERMKGIESENQRMLQKLMETKRRKKLAKIDPPVRRPHHSTINRQREQRKIEEENKRILERLNRVKPTKGMSKGEMIHEYKKQASYGLPLFLVQGGQERMPSVSRDPLSQSLRRVHSSSSLVRPSSAAIRHNSARRPPPTNSSRPDWPSGW